MFQTFFFIFRQLKDDKSHTNASHEQKAFAGFRVVWHTKTKAHRAKLVRVVCHWPSLSIPFHHQTKGQYIQKGKESFLFFNDIKILNAIWYTFPKRVDNGMRIMRKSIAHVDLRPHWVLSAQVVNACDQSFFIL